MNEIDTLKDYGTDLTKQQIQDLQGNENIPQLRHVDKTSHVNGRDGFNLGRFYISDQNLDKCIPVGKKFTGSDGKPRNSLTCMIGPFRATAMELVNNKITRISHDPDAPTFKDIRALKMSKEKVDGKAWMVGFEFLIWIPPEEIEKREQFPDGFCGIYFFKNTAARYAPTKFGIGTPMVLITRETPPWNGMTWWSPQERETLDINDARVKDWYEKGVEQISMLAPAVMAYKSSKVEDTTNANPHI